MIVLYTCVAVSSSLDHDQLQGQDQSTSTEKLVDCGCHGNVFVMTTISCHSNSSYMVSQNNFVEETILWYLCMCYHDYSVTENNTKRRCGMCHVPYSVTQPPFKVQLSKCLVCK